MKICTTCDAAHDLRSEYCIACLVIIVAAFQCGHTRPEAEALARTRATEAKERNPSCC